MRIDKHLDLTLNLTSLQTFFLNCWFNMVHQSSLDSYRVRVMNPRNILREFRRMYELHSDESDRRRVAEEALDIFAKHPVLEHAPERYAGLTDTIGIISEALAKSSKKGEAEAGKAEPALTKHAGLILSFVNELDASLAECFMTTSFDWLQNALSAGPGGEVVLSDREAVYGSIEKVCRDVLSVSLDDGISLESLFQIYRLMAPAATKEPEDDKPVGEKAPKGYDFLERLQRVRDLLTAPPKTYRVIFGIEGVSAQVAMLNGTYGRLTITEKPPEVPEDLPPRERKFVAPRKQWLFADATVSGRDGRSAAMSVYRQIGQILDLMRFEYDSRNMRLTSEFLLEDDGKYLVLPLPQLIPNPENESPTRKLEEFVKHMDGLAGRDGAHTESRDRIFAAFRLYRVGAEVTMFENKLVNWWTGIEYLAKGGKSAGGSIGAGVEGALAPTLGLIYLPKHLSAFRTMLEGVNAKFEVAGKRVETAALSNAELYRMFKDPTMRSELERQCSPHPYLWFYLQALLRNIAAPAMVAAALKAHERRVRWQIQRIYRARCDIVHSGQQVVTASLLCANLEYYLRMTLKSMLRSFQEVPTLRGPAEFFERRRYQYDRVLHQLESKAATDDLLIATLD
jgi:hypothetical protein